MSTIKLEPEYITIESDDGTVSFPADRAIAHIGLAGDQHGLCGARTLGVPANTPATCVACSRIWDQMTRAERRAYRGQS